MTARDVLTEEDAAKKHCPLARRHPMMADEQEPVTVFDVCIASQCMFWRWSQQDNMGTPTGFCGGAIAPKYI